MDCETARTELLDYHRGRLDPPRHAEVEAHLGACPACAHDEHAERLLTEALERRLPRYAAPVALSRRLAATWPATARASRPSRRWLPWSVAAVAMLAAALLSAERLARPDRPLAMVTEAVNDHLRATQAPGALELATRDIHQLRPWFAARLDFAPVIVWGGDAEFPLRGGRTEYFLDRPAAVVVYGRRLHSISLLVFRADGLPWPGRGLEAVGQARVFAASARGFNVMLWRGGDLGYALVSDVGPGDLRALARRLAAPSP